MMLGITERRLMSCLWGLVGLGGEEVGGMDLALELVEGAESFDMLFFGPRGVVGELWRVGGGGCRRWVRHDGRRDGWDEVEQGLCCGWPWLGTRSDDLYSRNNITSVLPEARAREHPPRLRKLVYAAHNLNFITERQSSRTKSAHVSIILSSLYPYM